MVLGDTADGKYWSEATGWQSLAPNQWAYGAPYATGTLFVWEYQWYPATETEEWVDLGSCQIYQYTAFFPYQGPSGPGG